MVFLPEAFVFLAEGVGKHEPNVVGHRRSPRTCAAMDVGGAGTTGGFLGSSGGSGFVTSLGVKTPDFMASDTSFLASSARRPMAFTRSAHLAAARMKTSRALWAFSSSF